MPTRRQFLQTASLGSAALARANAGQAGGASTDTLRLWAFSDSHVGTDMRHGRESLADALRQSESGGAEGGPPFDWDLALNLGDMSGGQDTPKDDEGDLAVRQFGALKKHDRHQIYSICGNHDRSGLDEPEAWWWRKWIDP
ncbi:MAG TPA: metallophosphoesterase, partial [Sphingomonadaceae bacterium]|nr:metallophosphoesterase [Sphingomonadaceae bacterium]